MWMWVIMGGWRLVRIRHCHCHRAGLQSDARVYRIRGLFIARWDSVDGDVDVEVAACTQHTKLNLPKGQSA